VNDDEAMWVGSALVNDEYVTVVRIGDICIPLSKAQATAYANTVITAVQYACYDAAQMMFLAQTKVSKTGEAPDEEAAMYGGAKVVTGMRRRRPDLDDQATSPLRFEPIVASRTRAPEVNVWHGTQQVAALTAAAACEHAMYVLAVAAGVGLDRIYRNVLASELSFGNDLAKRVVHGLQQHRDPAWDLTDPGRQTTITPPAGVTGGGIQQEARHRSNAKMPEFTGVHLWICASVYQVADPAGPQDLLDVENLLTLQGPGCYWCEQPYKPDTDPVCPGDPAGRTE
jgi:hypothetical protein